MFGDTFNNGIVNEILATWEVLLSDEKMSSLLKSNAHSKWTMVKVSKAINDSRKLDLSGLTTFMLLIGFLEDFMAGFSISLLTLVNQKDLCFRYISLTAKLYAQLRNESVTCRIDDLHEDLNAAAIHYAYEDRPAMDEWLKDRHSFGLIRKAALESMESLEVHRFAQAPSATPVDLKVNHDIYEMWNINSLLQAIRAQEMPGITMVMIRDPVALYSFFVFAIAKGDTITLLTDKPTFPHPGFKRMSRRPDRALEDRVGQHLFPYYLLNVEVSEDGRRLHLKQRDALVPIHQKAVALEKLSDLPPAEFIWAILMFDLIQEKYGKSDVEVADLSYTGEMIINPTVLIDREAPLVKKGAYQHLELEAIRQSEITTEATASQWKTSPVAHNQWMVDRYRDRVPDNALNAIGTGVQDAVEAYEQTTGLPTIQDRGWGDPVKLLDLMTLDPTSFGSAECLQNDRVWTARTNQIAIIKNLAEDEFKKTQKEALQWYQKAVDDNFDFCLDAVARGSVILPSRHANKTKPWDDPPIMTEKRVVRAIKRGRTPYGGHHRGQVHIDGGRYSSDEIYCYDKPLVLASVWGIIKPDCAEALAVLCGLKSREELPWQFRYWLSTNSIPYTGNSILDRLDPIDNLRNPWSGLSLEVVVGLSKNAVHARRRGLDLPRADWTAISDSFEY